MRFTASPPGLGSITAAASAPSPGSSCSDRTRPWPTSAPAPAVLERIGESLARLAGATEGLSANTAERALLLDALIASVARETVAKIVDPEVSFTLDELIDAGAMVPDAARFFAQLLYLLARFGAAHETGQGWRIVADHDLPEIAEVWRLLLAEAPELVAELALVPAAAEELP